MIEAHAQFATEGALARLAPSALGAERFRKQTRPQLLIQLENSFDE